MIIEADGQATCSSQSGAVETAAPSPAETHAREQIAQYLRDNAIQRIFAVGLGMTALAARLDDPQVQGHLAQYVDDLDIAISAIYAAVSELTFGESDQEGCKSF